MWRKEGSKSLFWQSVSILLLQRAVCIFRKIIDIFSELFVLEMK